MTLQETLEHSLRSASLPRFERSPAMVPEVAHSLIARYGDGDVPRKTAEELAALLRRVERSGFDWAKVGPADRLDVAWILWDGAKPPAEKEAFLRAFLDWIDTPWRKVQATRLAAVWANRFDPRARSIHSVADWLKERAAQLIEPWPLLAAEFDIFSCEEAPENLAAAFLAARERGKSSFRGLGLRGRAARGGLAWAALGATARRVEGRAADNPELALRLVDFATELQREDRVVGAAARREVEIAVAEAVLLPWHDAAPIEAIKERIIVYLAEHHGDVRTNAGIWSRVRPPARAILHDWLKRRTVATFFSIAGQTKAGAAQLRARKEFWMARLDRIDDAWFVGASQSLAAFGGERLGCGRLAGAKPEQCAMILKMKGMTIVETSYDEFESVWLAGNSLAPPPDHRPNHYYWPASFATGADFSSGYAKDGGEHWQERLTDFIEKHAGAPRPRADAQ